MVDDMERKVVELSVDDILPNRFQPRIKFDDSAIFELSESIKAHGVFQPIIVRPIGDKYEIIAGERRYKASVLANKKTVPAIVMNLDDNDTVEIALIENVQRANLTPIEEAISYKKILDMGYMNQEQLASKLGKTQSTIANKLRLLNLDEDVQDALLENKISERHARSLLKLKDFSQQRIMLKRIINERLTVRKTDEEIEKMFNNNQTKDIDNSPIMINNNSIPEIIDENETSNVSNAFGFGDSQEQNANSPFFNEEVDKNEQTNIINTPVNTSTVMNSNPIIEDVSDIPSPTEMNVDKIASTAKNVFSEKTLAPMDDILASDKTEEKDSNEAKNINLIQGKFFTFDNPVSQDTNNNNMVDKNFTFDNLYSNVSPVEPQEQQYSTPDLTFGDSYIQKQEQQDDEFISNSNPIVEDKNINSTIEANSNDQSLVDTPFGFGATVSNENQHENSSNNTIEGILNENNQMSKTESFDDIPQYQNLTTVQPEIKTEKNIMSAVGIIRKAIDDLKNMGYNVDVDEIDLETMYQLIVKIDK